MSDDKLFLCSAPGCGQMPLDLSPLATPMIIQNKIEDHSAVAAHRDSPLPHPESTTRDDKPSSLPSSTIVHPASLQVPNVLLATSDASVVIEQALPSPTSSSLITQASSSKRPIVLLSFPVLFQLPNGQTMPVAIPLTIASSVHIPTAVPKLKAVLSQQLPQASEAPPAQYTTTTGGRQRRATSEDPDEKRRKFLERNRAAVSRCRQKRKAWVSTLEKKTQDLNSMNGQLQNEVTLLRNEVDQLKYLLAHKYCPVAAKKKKSAYHITLLRNEVDQLKYLLAHKYCPVAAKKKKSAYHTSEEDSCEVMSVPDSLQSEAIQHSSVSISNGVSSSSMTPAVSALASAPVPIRAAQSTEEDQPQGGAALFTTQTQPSGS